MNGCAVQKIRVFLNKQASQGAERDWKKLIRERLFRSHLEFVNPGSAEEFLAEIDRATRDQIDVIISVGGDGTIHALIQKLAHKDISFLVLPAGTANDFARSLGVQSMKIHEVLSVIREGTGKAKRIDLVDINGKLMATNGGIGFISNIAARVNRMRQAVPGFKKLMSVVKQETYVAMLVQEILANKFEYYTLKVECEQFQGTIRTPLLMINNQPMIAASFPVAPNTKHNDGKCNVTIFLHQKPLDFLASVYRIRQGIEPENDPLIVSFETEAVRFESTEGRKLHFMGDGELLASADRFEVAVRPKALRVFAETVEQIHLTDFTGTEGK